jgi:molecular chaperone HscB
MEPLVSRSSRQLRSIYRNSSRAVHVTRRSYANSPICLACRAKGERLIKSTIPSRRWASQATTASSSPSTEPGPSPTRPPQTHYEFFPKTLPIGAPPSGPFVVDVRELRKEFLQLQAVAHPDRHPQELKQRAEATSARINEAYKTLQNSLLRAQYLLSLRGIDVAENESAKVEDPELLMEVLDTREQIETAQEEEEVQELRAVNDERIAKSEEILEEAFRSDDLGRAKEEAVKLRYWINIKESLDAWERGKPVVLIH